MVITFALPADAEIGFQRGYHGCRWRGITGTWIRYEGNRDSAGELVITKVEFIKPKPRKPKGDPAKFAQVTDFPPGSRIDLDGSLRIKLKPDKTDDTPGGVCGWYPVPDVPAAQDHVRRVGMRLVPQYQRDLPDDDPAKIHFRFYVVEEKDIRSALSCHEGLVLVPVTVINRLRSEDQLAAVLADGVAASLQLGQARIAIDWRVLWEEAGFAALSAVGTPWGLGYAGGMVGNAIVNHNMQRRLENQRGRVALSLMSDAGFDPWQAPECPGVCSLPEKLPKGSLQDLSIQSAADISWRFSTCSTSARHRPQPRRNRQTPRQNLTGVPAPRTPRKALPPARAACGSRHGLQRRGPCGPCR